MQVDRATDRAPAALRVRLSNSGRSLGAEGTSASSSQARHPSCLDRWRCLTPPASAGQRATVPILDKSSLHSPITGPRSLATTYRSLPRHREPG
jgi:hypothetical protein